MADSWFVRVQEKEYGPVSLDTLREWKAEGRLIATNEIRTSDGDEWRLAGTVADLFPTLRTPTVPPELRIRRRTLAEIIGDSLRIYRKGFSTFFGLALIVAVPSLGLKLSLAFVQVKEGGGVSSSTQLASIVAIVMLGAVLISWPLFVAGLQFATSDLLAGRPIRFDNIVRRAREMWGRVAKLSLFVYGSFLFWIALPFMTAMALMSAPSVLSLLLATLVLGFQVYIAARLFINFMFWQQASTLGRLDGVEALRESKELARSRKHEPLLQRPLYRGAIIASLWLLVLFAASMAVEFPFIVARLQGVTKMEDAVAIMQTVMNAPTPDRMTIATYVLSSLAHALLRPLLGIAFVLLYFDARADRDRVS